MSDGLSNIISILPGDYPDPSIIRVEGDYYLINSCNQYSPGLLIWHSRDLVNWAPVTTALKHYDGDIWAPDIVHYNGLFYIYYTTSGGNHVVTAPAIEGPWSEPIDLKLGHIDPGHIATPDGRRFLFLSGGHRVELEADGLSVKSDITKVYDLWPLPAHWRIEGEAHEGPKLIFRNGWYYMVIAAGGTAGPATSHMVLIARSQSIDGPWEDCPFNPIIKTMSRKEQWWSRGHGTLIDTPQGDWWIVYHAYENGYYTLGRSTVIQPILWTEDGWPAADFSPSRLDAIPEIQPRASLSDDFTSPELGWKWRFHGDFEPGRARVGEGELILKAEKEKLAQGNNPLVIIPRDHSYEIEVDVELDGDATDAGLVLYYSKARFVGFAISPEGVILQRGEHSETFIRREGITSATLRMVNDDQEVDFFVRLPGEDWVQLGSGQEVSGWHHNVFGGFVALRVGLYVSGTGAGKFSNFKYTALDA